MAKTLLRGRERLIMRYYGEGPMVSGALGGKYRPLCGANRCTQSQEDPFYYGDTAETPDQVEETAKLHGMKLHRIVKLRLQRNASGELVAYHLTPEEKEARKGSKAANKEAREIEKILGKPTARAPRTRPF